MDRIKLLSALYERAEMVSCQSTGGALCSSHWSPKSFRALRSLMNCKRQRIKNGLSQICEG